MILAMLGWPAGKGNVFGKQHIKYKLTSVGLNSLTYFSWLYGHKKYTQIINFSVKCKMHLCIN